MDMTQVIQLKPPASCTLWCLQKWHHRMNGGFISWSNPVSFRVCEHQAVIRVQPQNNNQKPFVSHIKMHQDCALTGLLDWGGMGQLQCSQTSSRFSIQSLSESVLQEQPIFSAIWENVALRNPHVLRLCTVSQRQFDFATVKTAADERERRFLQKTLC